MRRTLITLTLVAVVVGGLVVAERTSHTYLESEFVTMVDSTFPNTRIDRTDVRGRPYLVSRSKRMISTAYAYLYPAVDGSYEVVLVQDLDLTTGTAGRVRTFLTVPFPDGLPEPQIDTTPDRSQALFGDELVTYRAELDGNRVTFSTAEHGTDDRFSPPAASVSTTLVDGSMPTDARITRVVPKVDGVLVEITSEGIPLTIDR